MQGNYGTRFLNQWKTGQILDTGEDAGVVNAMATWGKKLAGFADKPECIRRVLDRLPPDPPSLPLFVEMCRQAPTAEKPALQHKLTPEERERHAEMARQAKRAAERLDADKIAHWATHPRSFRHLQLVFDAAEKEPRFQQAVGQMVEQGVCTAGGALLKRYAGMGHWEAM